MAKRRSASGKQRRPARSRNDEHGASKKRGGRKNLRAPRVTKNLIVRVAEPATRARGAEARAAAEPEVPEARIDRTGGTVSVEIAFGHAQHGKYTIQLFEPSGTTELARETGLSTDSLPDRFDLKLPAAGLDRHFVQWSGAVDAFSNAPGQRFSVIVDISQDGSPVPGGHVEKAGPLNITQAFLGVLRLVAS